MTNPWDRDGRLHARRQDERGDAWLLCYDGFAIHPQRERESTEQMSLIYEKAHQAKDCYEASIFRTGQVE